MESKGSFVGFLLVTLFAEIGASFWLLLVAPADGPTEVYSGFLNYEAWRALCWIASIGLTSLLYSFLPQRIPFPEGGRAVGKSNPLLFFISASALGFSIETLTSICYWKSPHSRGVRALYQSIWYWHRVPRPNDYGLPSFKAYFVDHLIPWAIIFLAGLIAWPIWNRRRRQSAYTPTTA
jgi:hypothetical protein